MSLEKDVSEIIDRALNAMNVTDIAWAKLVKGTMAAETGFKELFDEENDCYGFSMMGREWIKDVLRSHIEPNKGLQEVILKATGVNVKTNTIPATLEAMKYNIAFQAAMTYAAYNNSYLLSPNDMMEDLAGYYAERWVGKKDDETTKAEFRAAYKAVFVDK